MQDEIRVSRNGREVAIRNLNHPERADLKWRCTNGSYKTDKDVEGWIPLNRKCSAHLVGRDDYDVNYDVAFANEGEAQKYIATVNEYATEKVAIGEVVDFYPYGSRD